MLISIAGEIVCKQCYAKNYSCQANPLSGADMLKLLDTSLIKGKEDKDGKVEGCPRCQGQVGFVTFRLPTGPTRRVREN